MKKILLLILYLILSSYGLVVAQDNIIIAKKKIFDLKEKSKKIHGISLNEYYIIDLNDDGIFEVIERVNKIEHETPGFLNLEIFPAFEFDKIYKYSNGIFQEDYSEFSNYLIKRKNHYTFWKRLIKNPENLSLDSRKTIESNKNFFLKEVDRLIKLVDKAQK